ncbi:putative vacuolar sorting receptor [Piedraia hortae CBS 480.64]|uniref:Putative vacuolar sorting receptor n=1 Tax=Piedraia hortae CBS 480.64 TaxID=1314780 RepID=A0A6A7C187_9PEZI|nr:putative vacuolar sorting receptor [Piedraia hortae CBS 480.64]
MNRLLHYCVSALLWTTVTAASVPAKEAHVPEPCTIRSPNTHAFFDLNKLRIEDPTESKAKNPRTWSWNTTGWGLPYNFTMNFCGPVIERVRDVVGVEERLWRNTSAFYRHDGKVYSMGLQNNEPVFHGRKLVMNYTNGSPCGDKRRKSTIISMLCDKDPLSPRLTLSFIAASPDECTYFFEARSSAGCGGIETAKQTLSPAGVFSVIMLIAVLVYLVGGCFYNRMVLQQRGWKQLPNYSLWAGIFGFVTDILVILISSCATCCGYRRSYEPLHGRRGSLLNYHARDSEAENRLIDELNEEWDG